MRILSGHRGAVRALAYVPGDANSLASGGDDRVVRLWDLGAGGERRALAGHRDGVLCLTFTADGVRLASAGRNGELRVWHVATGVLYAGVQVVPVPVPSVAFRADGRVLLAAPRVQRRLNEPGLLLSWELTREGDPVQRQPWPWGVRCVAAGGGRVAVADEARAVEVLPGDEPGPTRRRQFSGVVCALAFAPPRHRWLAVAHDRLVEIWDVADDRRVAVCKGHRGEVPALAFSPDGRWLLTGSKDGTARLWDAAAGRPLASHDWRLGHVYAVAFAPDGLTAAAGGERLGVVIWDVDVD
jgi:WD40 repeat protein